MIRREVKLAAGEPGWLLISQIEHARLSGALASEWGHPPFPPLTPRGELLPAIIRHDDGWADWEQRPAIDPDGRPRDFMTMPVEEALLIWRASIERVAALSSLGGATVAGHFLHLLRHAEVWPQHGSRAAAAAHQWSAEFEALRRDWLDAWFGLGPHENTPPVAERALKWLQCFDRLSLWFCMQSTREPGELQTVEGPAIGLSPQQTADLSKQVVVVDPWPLRVPSLEISLSGRWVPQRRYADAADLAVTAGQAHVWQLHLVPA